MPPWKTPTPTEELEVISAPLPVGPIVMWQTAMITKYDLMLIEFTRDGANWTIFQRCKHYSALRMSLREKPESVRFVIIVTDPRNVFTRGIIKVSRDLTEVTHPTYSARAPLELVPRRGWPTHLVTKPNRPPTPQREKKPLIVEVVGSEKMQGR